MLSLEYLLEEAKSNGLPIIKKRGILREYLQVIILNSIYKHTLGKSMFFTGGTGLRFFYNLPRFSEDLDFDTQDLTFEGFKNIVEEAKRGLAKEGFSIDIRLESRKKLYIAEMYFMDLMRLYGITNKSGINLMVKIEVYKPPWRLKSESNVLSLYGYNFSAVLLERGYSFAEKICALLNRKRGRDVYDTLFMLRKRFPINIDVLVANKIELPPEKSILKHLQSLSHKELKFLANQVKPFLFKEDDIELILNAPLYAKRFLEMYNQ